MLGSNMKQFQGKDYLLNSELAVQLYEKYASSAPIFDFHCHLSPKQIYENHHFSTITEAWLGKDGVGDHYKWRLLREAGVDERLITGGADDYDRFLAFAKAMPSFIGNPIYEWTHLELKRYFGCDLLINEENAKAIYDLCNEKLKGVGARDLIKSRNVKALFTTDDPADDLHYHEEMAKEGFEVQVRPCWRPDRYLHIGNSARFCQAIADLEKRTGMKLPTLALLKKALAGRIDFFADHGCKAADHGLDQFRFRDFKECDAESAYEKVVKGETLSEEEIDSYESSLLLFLGKEYKRVGFVQQFHIGALRNTSETGYSMHGADFGYDATDDRNNAATLALCLSTLEKENALPPTVIYALNEKDYCSFVTIKNAFQKGEGYIQFGAAWWFNDHYDGIRKQIRALMAGGLISRFIGMLTDSRSFLSYPRHEYFRRILVDEIASLVEEGRYPYQGEQLSKIIQDICYKNAWKYFHMED